MNREIKFRAWLVYDKKWFDGNVLYYMSNCDIPNESEVVFQQYTGLKDKNGKEIYEGDVVRFIDDTTIPDIPTECITEVFWWDVMVCFSLKNTHHELNFTTCDKMEIIGNIYENPELL